jgi:hypothetical protein
MPRKSAMRFPPSWLRLALLLGLLAAGPAGVMAADGPLENVPGGVIDWNRGRISAADSRPPLEKENGNAFSRRVLLTAARVSAQENLLQAAKWVRLDSHAWVKEALNADPLRLNRLVDLVVGAPLQQTAQPDGGAAVTVELPLYGDFSELMLPEEIRTFSPLQPLATAAAPPALPSKAGAAPFSGLLLDATGIRINAALVIRVFDERGREVYGPAFADREQAVRWGMCGYARAPQVPAELPRLGANPLTLRVLRSEGQGASDLVIGNADAALLRGLPQHLAFLRRCAVVVLVR